MATVNVRELARNTSKVIDGIARRREATLVTRDGLPVAAIVPIDADALEDWILANAPEFVEGMRLADEEMKRGETFWLDERGRLLPHKPRKPRRAARRR
jgi:antitoxin (DNA-binding transcriptional repressor) of toxin-antitoxin stability system